MKPSQREMRFEVKSGSDVPEAQGGGYAFEGLGGVFLNLDWSGDILEPGATVQDLAYTATEGKIRDEHCVTTGRILEASEVPEGLRIKGLILPTAAGLDQTILVRGKAITRLSIGYTALKAQWLEGPEQVKAYWQSKGYTPSEDDMLLLGYFGCARLLQRVRVYEVSTTWRPVNDRARITSVKAQGQRGGLTLADQTAAALVTVGELVERAERVRAMRQEKGRGLSPESKARLKQLTGKLDALALAHESKGTDRDPANAQAEALREAARFEETLSALNL